MGTRADFYVGRGDRAGWIGSIAWDGDPSGIDNAIFDATTDREYRDAVKAMLEPRDDSTFPEQGWPWENSQTTDYAYAWDEGKVHASCFGHEWFDPKKPPADENYGGDKVPFPNMSAIQKVDFGERSGIMIFGAGE